MNDEIRSGQYVVAGVDTFVELFSKFIDVHDKSNHFNDEIFCNFLQQSISKYLFSYGTGLSYKTKRFPKNHTSKIAQVVQKIRTRPFMANNELYIDSGGFQVSMGAIDTKDMPRFIDDYHNFIDETHSAFDWAFCLDLPPGPGSGDIFDSYQQIEELNRTSYNSVFSLSEAARNKMIYIHHFRTPSLYKTWSKFLFEEGLGEGYKYYGTGGIVANLATDTSIPVIIYTIPLSSVLRYNKEQGKKQFKFHILGGANFSDVFYHKLFTHHIKKVHDIDVEITYDSSAIFKGLAIGRFIPVLNSNEELVKMDLRSNQLHLKFDGTPIHDKVYQLLNEIASIYQFKELNQNDDPIYERAPRAKSKAATFSRSVHMYLMCHILKTYRQIELNSEKFVSEIYPYYENGEIEEFDSRCLSFTKKLNQGKSTKKQKAKTYSLYKSLKILEDLDEEYNEYLVQKFMASSDISCMQSGGALKF